MRAVTDPDPLAAALSELSALGADPDRVALASLGDRLASQRLRVLVAGEAKRGKSTLVNALLGRAVLPTGVTPLTALATTVRHGHDERVTAAFPDGRVEEFPLTALDDLVTERGNPANRRQLASVTVTVDAPLLARGVELVDTPGTGSVFEHSTAQATAALETMDAAVFVLTADPPASASERELMSQVAGLSVTMFVALNKADHLAAGELAEVVEFTRHVIGEATGSRGPLARIYPMSAREALLGDSDLGFAAFLRDFTGYVERGRAADLRRSAEAHARRIAVALRDAAALARRAAQLPGEEAEQRVRAFVARLDAAQVRRQDATDLVQAESWRLLKEMNEAAAQAARDAVGRVRARLDAELDGRLRAAAPGEIERAGQRLLAELSVAEAEAWRRQRAGLLEAALARLDERLTGELWAELDKVRQAAAELLDLELAVPVTGQRLAPDLRFFYLAGPDVGQTELLADAVRRRLPGEAGRNRARAHLRREAADLVPAQIGRARADLQHRLAEATRRLARSMADRYEEGTGRLEKALAEADGLRTATEKEVADRDRHLADRLAALDRVLALLDAAGDSETA